MLETDMDNRQDTASHNKADLTVSDSSGMLVNTMLSNIFYV